MDLRDSKYILVTDIGSTTTKALLISSEKGSFCFAGDFEVSTTVEKPTEDVKIGVVEAIKGLQAKTGTKLLSSEGRIAVPYLTTSSAGGGLQILVFGLAAVETGRVAQMTAYGAGGVILRTLTIDDLILPVQKMRLIRELHPDMILMAGGLDGGAISGVVSLAEILSLADPEPKFRQSEKIPLVFCGNVDAQRFVSGVLEPKFEVHITPNIRPSMKKLNVEPAKRKVHELFMENVMERAPGYAELKNWVASNIIPTPVGVESILRLYGEQSKENIVAVDIGGATTDIFSNIMGAYHRTVAANIGVSYSLSNVLREAGVGKIMQHLPENFSEEDVRNYISNKTLNPTYVPRYDCERLVEEAAAIEGIRFAWEHHKEMNFKLSRLGRLDKRRLRKDVNPFEELFYLKEDTYFQPKDINLIIGAGGILSHVKSIEEALWILVEGFQPSDVTRLAIDRNFKSPHLGVLSKLDPRLALGLFTSQCLEDIGWVVAPSGRFNPRKLALTVNDTTGRTWALKGGDLLYLEKTGELEILPAKNVCLGANLECLHLKTDLPVLFDCRGRGERMSDLPLAKSGIWGFFSSAGFKTDVRKDAALIYQGEYCIERRLPYEGEIFVREGEKVKPDTLIGENRFGPPKLYVLDIRRMVGYRTALSDEEVLKGILVKVKDSVSVGQGIFRGKGKILNIPYYLYSPVRGTITQIEPGGLIIMREIQDYDGRPHIVNVAKEIKIKPEHLKSYLKFKIGDFVEADRILAQKLTGEVPAISKSPTTGILKEIDTEKGTVTIQYEIKPIPLKSFVKGKVSRVIENLGVAIKGKGTTLYGIIGFGGEAFGELLILKDKSGFNESVRGKVVVFFEPADEAFLRRAVEVEVVGIVVPSLDNLDWVHFWGQEMGAAVTGDEKIPFSIILTEGFGHLEMNEAYRRFFKEAEGKLASLTGRTQIRAGVRRPMVIVSES